MILKWKKCLQKHFLYLHFVQSNICVLKYSIFQRERLNKMSQHSKDTLCQLCQHGTCCFQEIYSWVPIILFVTMITELLGWWCFDCVWKGLELLCGHTVESTKFGFLLASGSFCHGENMLSSRCFDYVAVRIVACEPATNRGGVTSQHGQWMKMARIEAPLLEILSQCDSYVKPELGKSCFIVHDRSVLMVLTTTETTRYRHNGIQIAGSRLSSWI